MLRSLANQPNNPQARFQKFSFSQLVNATDSFSLEEQMEQGPLATLYKGRLQGSDVTIKWLTTSSSGQQLPQSISEYELFQNEIKILPELQHTNIIKLVGFCTEQSERIVVYEYMQNGSLENVIFGMFPTENQNLSNLSSSLGQSLITSNLSQCYCHIPLELTN
ncbi:hypothetical protein ABZP36_009939 [Zizania latifolia]